MKQDITEFPLPKDSPIRIRLRMQYKSMHKAEQAVADYILQHPAEDIAEMSITDMAACMNVSESTLMRVCKRIGMTGFSQFKLRLAQECGIRQNSSATLSGVPIVSTDSASSIPEKVINNAISGLIDTKCTLDSAMLVKAIQAILSARRIALFGMANSAVVCDDLECKLLRIGIVCHSYSDAHMQMTVASHLTKEDVVIAVSHSGHTLEVLDAVRLARKSGTTIIIISNYMATPLISLSDIQLLTGGHETSFNSETMVSRLSQLAIVDMLYVGLILSDYDRYTKMLEDTNDVLKNKRVE